MAARIKFTPRLGSGNPLIIKPIIVADRPHFRGKQHPKTPAQIGTKKKALAVRNSALQKANQKREKNTAAANALRLMKSRRKQRK